nr:MAG TPA: hypothetical protein [Caudoviricetes sp.]
MYRCSALPRREEEKSPGTPVYANKHIEYKPYIPPCRGCVSSDEYIWLMFIGKQNYK